MIRPNKQYIIFLILVILLCIIFMPTAKIRTAGTSENYLMQALRLVRGEEGWIGCYADRDSKAVRPPGYPLMIAAVFKLAGVSLENAFYMTRFFYALNIFVVFLLASALFGPGTGLISSFFIIASSVIRASGMDLNYDIINPSIILLSIWLFVKQFENRKLAYSAFAGFLLAAAYWVKEFALLFIFLPFFAFLFKKDVSLKYIMRALALFYISFIAAIIPWIVYIMNQKLGLFMILAGASPESLGKVYGHANFITIVLNKDLFANLSAYYKDYLKPNFSVAPLMLIAWLYVMAIGIIKRRKEVLFLGLCGISCVPLIVFLGKTGERLGQNIVFFDLSYIAISYLAVSLTVSAVLFVKAKAHRFSSVLSSAWKFEPLGNFPRRITIALGIVILSAAVFRVYPKVENNIKQHLILMRNFYIDRKFTVEGRLSYFVKDGCEWLNQNVPKGERVYVDGAIWETFDFFTSSNFRKEPIPPSFIGEYNVATGELKNPPSKEDGILGIWPAGGFQRKYERYRRIEWISREEIRNLLEIVKNYPLIIYYRNNFIGYYLEQRGANLRYQNHEIKIYRGIKEARAIDDIQFLAGNGFVASIPWLKENYPDDYERLVNFLNKYGLTEDVMINSTYEKYQLRWVSENIPKESRIAFSCCCDVRDFFIKDIREVKAFNQDNPLSWFEKEGFDYMIIHHCRRYYNEFPVLFKELEEKEPMIHFPESPYLGEGMGEVYRLK